MWSRVRGNVYIIDLISGMHLFLFESSMISWKKLLCARSVHACVRACKGELSEIGTCVDVCVYVWYSILL